MSRSSARTADSAALSSRALTMPGRPRVRLASCGCWSSDKSLVFDPNRIGPQSCHENLCSYASARRIFPAGPPPACVESHRIGRGTLVI